MIGLKLDGEETFFGEDIDTPEEFIEDLCERVNTVYSTVIEENDKMNQLAYLVVSYKRDIRKFNSKLRILITLKALMALFSNLLRKGAI